MEGSKRRVPKKEKEKEEMTYIKGYYICDGCKGKIDPESSPNGMFYGGLGIQPSRSSQEWCNYEYRLCQECYNLTKHFIETVIQK